MKCNECSFYDSDCHDFIVYGVCPKQNLCADIVPSDKDSKSLKIIDPVERLNK